MSDAPSFSGLVHERRIVSPFAVAVSSGADAPSFVVGGVVGIGDRAGADRVDRRDPVVAGLPGGRATVVIGGTDVAVARRVLAVREVAGDPILPTHQAVGGPLDPVAGDRPSAGVAGRPPGEVDPPVADHRRFQPRRPRRCRRRVGRPVGHREPREALRVVAVPVLGAPPPCRRRCPDRCSRP